MTPFEELALITARIQRAKIIDPCDRAEDDRDLKALDEAIERAEKSAKPSPIPDDDTNRPACRFMDAAS